ncbi:hypothetical protein LCGC14_0313640 [marine sediment metagenome]|uniref:Uncharacterized protein n=1 Tax=marine sediment metagenome TaxID=412755 RepID=A0A0F9U463_9ZZZZ
MTDWKHSLGALTPGKRVINPRFDSYVGSESWHCPESPTGAHRMLLTPSGIMPVVGVCAYCGQEKVYPPPTVEEVNRAGVIEQW